MSDEDVAAELENAHKADEANAPDEPQKASGDEEQLSDKYRGKSPVEIAKMHEDLERKLGEQGREFGEYKKALDQMQSELAYYRNQPKSSQKPQEPEEDLDSEFFNSPSKAVSAQMRKELNEFKQQLRHEQANREAPRVLQEVKRSDPEIFGDPEVEANTMKFLNYAVQQGGDPMMLADPQVLIAVGTNMKYQKDKQSPQRSPVSPTQTESPSAVRSQEPAKKRVEFDDYAKNFLNYMIDREPDAGIKSMKDAAELMEEESD